MHNNVQEIGCYDMAQVQKMNNMVFFFTVLKTK